MPLETLRHEVNRAMIGWINFFERRVLRPGPFIKWGKRMWSRPGAVETTTDRQRRVADGLGVEPAAVVAPIKAIAWIGGRTAGIGVAGQAVGLRVENQPMDRFHRP